MSIQEQAQALHQETVGKVSVAIGGSGSLAQAITEWGNMFIMFGNLFLVAGGLYLMYHKIFDRRRNRRETDKE